MKRIVLASEQSYSIYGLYLGAIPVEKQVVTNVITEVPKSDVKQE